MHFCLHSMIKPNRRQIRLKHRKIRKKILMTPASSPGENVYRQMMTL